MFEWHTEEEEGLADLPPPEPTRPERRIPWRMLILVAAVVCLGGFSIYRAASGRVAEVTETVQEELLASVRLVERAEAAQDNELFLSMLPPSHPIWTASQLDLFEAGWLRARPDMGLYLDGAPRMTGVELNADLRGAVVTYTQRFMTPANPISTNVTLIQSFTYEKVGDRWLLFPPDDSFWGATTTHETEHYLRVIYPVRDEAMSIRLADDLDEILVEVCQLFACPDDFGMRLRLAGDPNVLANLTFPVTRLVPNDEVVLPSPTLLGLPSNEASYETIYHIYARHLLAGAVGKLVGYRCCRSAAVYDALLSLLYDDLGIAPQPVTEESYRQMLEDSVQLQTAYGLMDRVWSYKIAESGVEREFLLAVLQFYRWHDNSLGLSAIFEAFAASDAGDFSQALGIESDRRQPDLVRAQGWLRFLRQQSGLELAAPPLPLPDEVVYLVCQSGAAGVRASHGLYRLDLDTQHFSQTVSHLTGVSVQRLANGDLIVPGYTENGASEIVRFDGESLSPVYVTGDGSFPLIVPFTQIHRYLPVQVQAATGTGIAIKTVDLETCDRDGCQVQESDSIGLWSPDAQRSLVVALDTGRFSYGDASGMPLESLPAEDIRNVAWISNHDFLVAKVMPAEEGAAWLDFQVYDWQTQEMSTIGSTLDLPLEGLGAPTQVYFSVRPNHPEQLVVALGFLTDEFEYRYHVLALLDLNDGHWEILAESIVRSGGLPPFSLSPDGKWVAYELEWSQSGLRQFVDLETGEKTEYALNETASISANPLGVWSADSRWQLSLGQRHLFLVAPEDGLVHSIMLAASSCSQALFSGVE